MLHDVPRMEQRASPRVAVQGMRVGLVDGSRSVHGNLSTGGVGFELEDCPPLRAGDPMVVSLLLPDADEPVAVSAIVCRVHYDERRGRLLVGARFVDVDALVECPLFRFVEEAALFSRTAI